MTLVKFNDSFPGFSSLFDNFLGRDMDEMFNWTRVDTAVPAVNIREEHDTFHVEIAAPGLKREDFQVTLDNGLLTITAEKGHHSEENGNGSRYTRREFGYRSFSRSFTLPSTVEAEQIDARYQDGILHLVVPKKEEAKRKAPRQITIG
jgi:HSP20 family protein